ncbi:hypothetical protein NFI96_022117 [Prochilodus magdalenae]|nr:hypothetical protein NFI96_022117 [Prochilodus magdalenae]
MAEGSEPVGAGLQAALERLCSSRTLRLKPETPVCVAVIGLDRYLADERASHSYSYDVTVTDGTWRVKCHLSSALHGLVQRNVLRCGSAVSVSHLSFVYDERRLGQSYVCLEELECDPGDAGIVSSIKDPNALPWWTQGGVGNSLAWHADAPLRSGRKHYLSLWNNEDPHGRVWVPNAPPPDTVLDVSKICLLGDLDVFFVSSRRPLPLLVRVLHRSRLRYYGKPGQNIDYPFQAYFEVADQSGVMSMVLWNDLCPEWYHRLVVGSVVYLQHYSLKKSYQNRSRPQIGSLPLISFTNIVRGSSAVVRSVERWCKVRGSSVVVGRLERWCKVRGSSAVVRSVERWCKVRGSSAVVRSVERWCKVRGSSAVVRSVERWCKVRGSSAVVRRVERWCKVRGSSVVVKRWCKVRGSSAVVGRLERWCKVRGSSAVVRSVERWCKVRGSSVVVERWCKVRGSSAVVGRLERWYKVRGSSAVVRRVERWCKVRGSSAVVGRLERWYKVRGSSAVVRRVERWCKGRDDLEHCSFFSRHLSTDRSVCACVPRVLEICLNPRNPSAVFTVIPPKSVQPQWSLPDVTYNFSTRSEIESLASNQACDVIGLVTYVGRVERIRNKGHPVPEKFWTYRWVHAVDGTSDSPFVLEIFSSSQPDIFNNICPMTYLVCTQMRVCREADGPVYLTSSAETQLSITGCHKKQPYVADPKVKAFIQWTKTLKDSVILRKTAVGGHYSYPPPPPTFTPHTTNPGNNTTGAAASSPLTAVADLQAEIESLHYRERRRVAIQGHITAVRYHRWPQEALQPGVHAEQDAPRNNRQLESDTVAESRGSAPSSSTGSMEPSAPPPSDSTSSPKRRRMEQGAKAVQRQYWTRAKVQSERQIRLEDNEDERASAEEQSEEGHSNQTTPTPQSPETTGTDTGDTSETGSAPDPHQAGAPPSAWWESSVWPLLKQDVRDHVSCGFLDPESVPERFRFDDRDVLLHRVNLSPSRWIPELPLNTPLDTHTPVDCAGYLTLTVLGLNQQAAVDALFIPVLSPEDPRAVGMPALHHDNTLMSCLSTGRVCVQATGAHLSPEALLSSASALEEERLVCMLDLCLLGQNRVEIICSKVYRTVDIAPV